MPYAIEQVRQMTVCPTLVTEHKDLIVFDDCLVCAEVRELLNKTKGCLGTAPLCVVLEGTPGRELPVAMAASALAAGCEKSGCSQDGSPSAKGLTNQLPVCHKQPKMYLTVYI